MSRDDISLTSARYVLYALGVLAVLTAVLHLADRSGSAAALAELHRELCARELPPILVAALAQVDEAGDKTKSAAPQLFAEWIGGPRNTRARVLYVRPSGLKEQTWGANELGQPWGGLSLEELARHARQSSCTVERDGAELRAFRPHRTAGGTRVLL
jgi:hypothetical protein